MIFGNRMKLCMLLLWAFMLCGIGGFASAQTYSIRVQHNSNLRAEASLDSQVIQSAPAGTVLQVIGSFGRWLRISRAEGDLWMADWISYSRVDGAPPAASQAGQPATSGHAIPVNVDNCCFVDRQCTTDADWSDGYWAYQNGQCVAPPQTQAQPAAAPASSAPASNVDNCCFIDRQCNTDAEWTDGFFAYQNNQCASSQTQSQTPAQQPAQSVSSIPADVNNCCQVDRECHSAWEWEQGFYAFLAGQCRAAGALGSVAWSSYMPDAVYRFLQNPSHIPFNNCCRMFHNCQNDDDWNRGHKQFQEGKCAHPAPPGRRPAIVGNDKFRYLVDSALGLIAAHAPEWLHMIDHSGTRMFETRVDQAGGFYNQDWSIAHGWTSAENDDPNWLPDFDYIVGYAGGITHEACHAIMQLTNTSVPGWRNEAPCLEAQLAVIEAINPNSHDLPWLRDSIANIQNPETWWWD